VSGPPKAHSPALGLCVPIAPAAECFRPPHLRVRNKKKYTKPSPRYRRLPVYAVSVGVYSAARSGVSCVRAMLFTGQSCMGRMICKALRMVKSFFKSS